MTVKKETRKIYVADDGKTFYSENECANYEMALKFKNDFAALKAKVDEIEFIEDGRALFGSDYIDEERYEYRWFRPKNIEEVAALQNFFHLSIDLLRNISEILGEWLCIEIDGGYDEYTGDEDVYLTDDFNEANENLAAFYKKLGYDVQITKQQSAVNARDKAIEYMWMQFKDIQMNPETKCIEQPFYQFQSGTSVDEIWEWFDKQYSKGVTALSVATLPGE